MEWLGQNWFQLFAVASMLLSWAVHYGISTQKWKATEKRVNSLEVKLQQCVTDIERKIDGIQASFAIHTTNSEVHVSPTLLQLFHERSEFMKLQLTETRSDIQRIEGLLTAGK